MTAQITAASTNPFFAAGERFTRNGVEFSLFCKDVLQGLVSALMLIVGTGHMMAEDAALSIAPAGLDGAFFEALLSGRMMGALEIGVAALLFLSTRRGVARTLGVLVLLGYVGFHNTGLTAGDLLSGASSTLFRLAEALEMTSVGA